MTAELPTSTVSRVDKGERGAHIAEMRERLAWSVRHLADRAGVDRVTLTKIEAGDESVLDSNYDKVERALNDLMLELFPGAQADHVIRLRLPMPGADDLVVEGNPEDIDALVEAVSKILEARGRTHP